MQADLEAAATRGKFTALASLGYQNPKNSLTLQDHLISRRHYLSYQLTDNYSVRGGRFLPAFGINTPDHISATRQPLGFGQGLESYNLEGSYIGDKTNIFITGILGRPDAMALDREKGAAVQGAYAIYDKTKLGLSSFYGKNRRGTRTLVGPYGLISFSDNLVLLTELDFQFRSPVGQESIAGAVNSQKLSYELRQGFWGFVTQDWSRQDFKNERTTAQAYGVGLQVFPRPHFEFNLSWQRQKLKAFSEEFFDYAWLMSHFYF
ncbi:MAG: hypothetical protein H7222_00605 [Methylotenera sp.]|nr:hypothetical protein [Oligoflexia bacterium]